MLIFACVNASNYMGRGKEYVEILHDSVVRNISYGTEGKFVCFTDDPEPYADGIEKRPLHGGLKGWYNKLYLFKKGVFDKGDKIIFFDLDTVIVSGLDEIIKYKGKFAMLEDFYRPNGFQSSVMMWWADFHHDIWDSYEKAGYPDVAGGDQAWIEQCDPCVDKLQDLFPKCFVSYKVSATSGIPKDSKVVVFHGNPRPHAAKGWVEKVWKIGGGSSIEMDMIGNVAPDKMADNIRHSLTLGYPHLDKLLPLQGIGAVLVGGGPSLQNYSFKLQEMAQTCDIFALNGSYIWLKERGIMPEYHIIADARPENAQFIDPEATCTFLIASHCDKAVFDALVGKNVILWHRGHEGMEDLVDPKRDKFVAYISGGSTVGLVSLSISYTLGYRNFHLFGYDSSYSDNRGHAYEQTLNDGERIIDIDLFDRQFKAAPWMIQQVNEYSELAPTLIEMGCQITTYGDGMLQHVNRFMEQSSQPDDGIKEKDGFWWPNNDVECKASIEHFLDDADWIMGFCSKFDVAVQAGGNVGIWPKKLAEKFKTVYTFEPDALNFQCLARNCPETNIVKIQGGLGDTHAMFGMQTLRHNCGAHFVDGAGIYPTFRLDDFKFPALDLVQLDIEGFEFMAIKGGFVNITLHRPVVVLELKGLGDKFGYSDYDVEVFMDRIGYEISGRKHRDVVFTYKGETK